MRARSRISRRRTQRAFTLIEMMAVVVIMGLLMTFFLPNLGAARASALRAAGRELAAHVEFARQRAVMTSRPHRVLIDIESGQYWLEWFVSEEEVGAEDGALAPLDPLASDAPLDLSAPRSEGLDYYPVPSLLGEGQRLAQGVGVLGLETSEGFIETGEVAVVFQTDGLTDPAQIHLFNEDDHRVVLEIQPLLGLVRIRDAEDG